MSDFVSIEIQMPVEAEQAANTCASAASFSTGADLSLLENYYETGEVFDDKVSLFITKNPEICQGEPTILGTRISVVNIVEFRYQLGWDVRQILEEYPSLGEQQINAALEYYDLNKEEIDRYLAEDRAIDGLR